LPAVGRRASLDLFAEEEEMKRFHYVHTKDVITSLSLSNLCFLAAWRSALYSPDPNGYSLTEYSMWRNSVGLMLDVLLLAALFWASYAFARSRRQERLLAIARWVFLFVVFSALDGLMIKFDGAGEPVGWSTQPNVFSRTREIGGAAAVVGWYHPYCRVIGGDLTRCSFAVVANEMDTRGQRVSRSMLEHFRMVGAAAQVIRQVLPKSMQSDKRWEFDYVEGLKRIAQESAAAATDSALSLVLIHFPAPHFPCLYDRRKDDFTFEGGCNYFDNLELVDRTFGDLRRSMERAGLWDDTVVLVSSDHWWRTEIWPKNQSWTKEEQSVMSKGADYHVPFMLKLKRQRASVIYQPSFNTVLSQDLLLALLRGELSAPPDVTAWLDRHRSIEKSPY